MLDPPALRHLAEAACQPRSPTDMGQMTPQDSLAALHELRVHQIELQLQNEELCRAGLALDTSRARYFDLLDLAPIGFCSVNEKGMVTEVNLAAAKLLGVNRHGLIRQALSQFVLPQDQARFYRWRRQVLQSGQPQTCQLQMKDSAGTPFWAELNGTATALTDHPLLLRLVLSDISERKKTEVALQAAQQRLRNLALRQQEEFDALRAELAHDVHDQLGQTLAVLKLEIDSIRQCDPSAAARMQALIVQGVASIRDISRALRPIALELGLAPALRALAGELSARTGRPIEVHLPACVPRLAGPMERGLYRIAQEALTNALRHAQATQIEVRLTVVQGRLELGVYDDGRGFVVDLPGVSGGLGLLGMHERAAQFGAEFSVSSAPKQGTRITVRWCKAKASRTVASQD